MTGAECVAHARALQRAHNASGAARLAAVLEVGLCAPDSGERVERMAAPDRYSVDEIRAMYALSIAAAHKVLDLAWAVCRRLPALYEAMAAGELDETRAWAIAHWTEQLSDEHARLVCAQVLPHCLLSAEEPWVTGKLIAEIKKLAIALDPEWAERMYADAVRRRRVAGWRNPDGSADLAGQQLEVDRVAAACGRLRELGKRAKRDGDPRPIDAIRADLFLGMLDGTYEGLSAEQILDDYAKTRPEPEPAQADPGASQPAASPTDGPGPSASDELMDVLSESMRESARQSPRIGVQLRVKLSTLLRWDDHPGELAGWGPARPRAHPAAGADALARDLAGRDRRRRGPADLDQPVHHPPGGMAPKKSLGQGHRRPARPRRPARRRPRCSLRPRRPGHPARVAPRARRVGPHHRPADRGRRGPLRRTRGRTRRRGTRREPRGRADPPGRGSGRRATLPPRGPAPPAGAEGLHLHRLHLHPPLRTGRDGPHARPLPGAVPLRRTTSVRPAGTITTSRPRAAGISNASTSTATAGSRASDSSTRSTSGR